MDVAYAFQELSNIPENYQVPDGRKNRGELLMQCLARLIK